MTKLESTRGRWSAPQLRGRDIHVLMLGFCGLAAVRAWDYATGLDGVAAAPNSALGAIERAFPLGVWAAALAVGVTTVLAGMVGRWTPVVATGSLLLGLVYFGISAGLLVEYLARPALDGIRGATGLGMPAVWHIIVATHAITLRRAAARPDGGAHDAG